MVDIASDIGEENGSLIGWIDLWFQFQQIFRAPALLFGSQQMDGFFFGRSCNYRNGIQIKIIADTRFIDHGMAMISFVVTPDINLHRDTSLINMNFTKIIIA